MGVIEKKHYEFLDIFNQLGVVVESVERLNGRHIRIKCHHNDRKTMFFMPTSVSDHRGVKNFHGEVKRWVKGLDR